MLKKIVCILLSFCVIFTFCLKLNVDASMTTSAKASILINADTLDILYANNENLKLPMASTTKIMTALLLAEQGTPNKTIVTTKEMVTVEGSSMGLLENDTVSYYALLCGMLLSSGNDAANTTAIAVSGSVNEFIKLMNKKATELGMKNTSFATPSGLDDENHYSTCYDMAILTATALKNKVFSDVCSKTKITVEYGNPPYKRTLTNHNKLLNSYNGTIGVKTGFTKKSGRCLVSAANRNDCTLIAVTLNDPNDWADHQKMFDYGFEKVSKKDITYNFDNTRISVVGGMVDSVEIYTEPVGIGTTNNQNAKIDYKINLESFLYAPVEKDKVIGNISYFCNGLKLYNKPIYTKNSVDYHFVKESSFLDIFMSNINKILVSIN